MTNNEAAAATITPLTLQNVDQWPAILKANQELYTAQYAALVAAHTSR